MPMPGLILRNVLNFDVFHLNDDLCASLYAILNISSNAWVCRNPKLLNKLDTTFKYKCPKNIPLASTANRESAHFVQQQNSEKTRSASTYGANQLVWGGFVAFNNGSKITLPRLRNRGGGPGH